MKLRGWRRETAKLMGAVQKWRYKEVAIVELSACGK